MTSAKMRLLVLVSQSFSRDKSCFMSSYIVLQLKLCTPSAINSTFLMRKPLVTNLRIRMNIGLVSTVYFSFILSILLQLFFFVTLILSLPHFSSPLYFHIKASFLKDRKRLLHLYSQNELFLIFQVTLLELAIVFITNPLPRYHRASPSTSRDKNFHKIILNYIHSKFILNKSQANSLSEFTGYLKIAFNTPIVSGACSLAHT